MVEMIYAGIHLLLPLLFLFSILQRKTYLHSAPFLTNQLWIVQGGEVVNEDGRQMADVFVEGRTIKYDRNTVANQNQNLGDM